MVFGLLSWLPIIWWHNEIMVGNHAEFLKHIHRLCAALSTQKACPSLLSHQAVCYCCKTWRLMAGYWREVVCWLCGNFVIGSRLWQHTYIMSLLPVIMKKRKSRFCMYSRVCFEGAHPFCSALKQRGLNRNKLAAYDPTLATWLAQFASGTFNWLGRCSSSPSNGVYCCA